MADKKIIDLERLQQFLSKCDARYIRYGKKVYDGTLGAGTSDLAGNLIATKGLTVNDDPMSFGVVGGAQKSAVGDGNASLNKLVCVDVVRNQLIEEGTCETNTSFSSFTYDSTTDTYTATVNEAGAPWQSGLRCANGILDGKQGHIVLALFYSDDTSTTFYTNFLSNSIIDSYNKSEKLNWIIGSYVGTRGFIGIASDATGTFHVSKPIIKDLTQRYGNNGVVNAIIGTGTDDEKLARLLAFDPEILSDTAYDAGTLVPSKTAKLLSVGVNQWDEEWEQGAFDTTTGTNFSSSNQIRSKNPFRVIGGQTYKCHGATCWCMFLDDNLNVISLSNTTYVSNNVMNLSDPHQIPINAKWMKFYTTNTYGGTYNHNICVNISDPNLDGKYYPSKRTPVTLPNETGHGILKVVDGKVVADGTELYPDGNSKKRYVLLDLGTPNWSYSAAAKKFYATYSGIQSVDSSTVGNILCPKYEATTAANLNDDEYNMHCAIVSGNEIQIKNLAYTDAATFKSAMSGVPFICELAAEEDITTSVYQANFPVEQGGTLQFLDENDNPIAGLQGSEIFYQKNIKAFVEAFGEAIDWDPARIERLANLSFTPEYVNITLDPSPTGAYARAQVYNATFTIVISAALTGTPSGSITFQDSEVDLTNFQTKPAEAIYDMDDKKVSEAPVTADCNIASFVGRSKSGVILWSLLHSGVNKVKIHIEEAVPLDNEGNGKIDCRASLIL